jgi:hypothetical protein
MPYILLPGLGSHSREFDGAGSRELRELREPRERRGGGDSMRVPVSLLAVCVMGLGACSTMKIHADWDPEVDLSTVQTWSWADVSQKETGNPTIDNDDILGNRVRRAVESEMTAKGLRQLSMDADSYGDIQLAFFLTVDDKVSVTTINNHYGYGRGYGYGGYGGSQTVVDQYQQGTLVLDISQEDGTRLVWRGSASARLGEKTTPEKSQAKVNEAVSKILARFPPPSAKEKE